MENMESRIKELEKSLRKTRAVLTFLVMFSLALGIMAAAGDDVKDVVKCHELVLVGPNGDTLATMAQFPDGGVALAFVDKNGQARVAVGHSQKRGYRGWGIATYNEQGTPTAGVAHMDTGERMIGLLGNDGKPRAMLAITSDDSLSYLAMTDSKGKPTHVKPFQALKLLHQHVVQ